MLYEEVGLNLVCTYNNQEKSLTGFTDLILKSVNHYGSEKD